MISHHRRQTSILIALLTIETTFLDNNSGAKHIAMLCTDCEDLRPVQALLISTNDPRGRQAGRQVVRPSESKLPVSPDHKIDTLPSFFQRTETRSPHHTGLNETYNACRGWRVESRNDGSQEADDSQVTAVRHTSLPYLDGTIISDEGGGTLASAEAVTDPVTLPGI